MSTFLKIKIVIAIARLQKNNEGDANSTEEEGPSLTRRVMDVMLMKKTNIEKNVEHYKVEGVKLTGTSSNKQVQLCSNLSLVSTKKSPPLVGQA